MTLTMFLLALGTVLVTEAMKQLAADVRLAMQRCGLTLDWTARLIDAQPNKLSLQLNGYLPFTLFCRFADIGLESAGFWNAFLEIRAERAGLMVMPHDMTIYLARVDEVLDLLTAGHKPMAKMSARVVTLPLTKEGA